MKNEEVLDILECVKLIAYAKPQTETSAEVLRKYVDRKIGMIKLMIKAYPDD